jgi:hypothetical protein
MLNAYLLGIVAFHALVIYGLFCWLESEESRLDGMARILISVILLLIILAIDVGGIVVMVNG